MEYTNGTKATWRYWAWKQLREKIRIQPGLATVLFLSGPSPEDLAAATKNGFKIRNIVAVDIDPNAVKAARTAGCVAIEGDIHDVVKFWDDGEIHAVMADYCCGMSYEQFVRSREMIRFVNGPVCLNFQRGRESSTATTIMRLAIEKHGGSKNRAEQFILMLAASWWHTLEYQNEVVSDSQKLNDMIDCNVETMKHRVDKTVALSNPRFMSYRSNSVIMDSVVMCDFASMDKSTLAKLRNVHRQMLKLNSELIDDKSGLLEATKEWLKFESAAMTPISQDDSDLIAQLQLETIGITKDKRSVKSQRHVVSRLCAAKAVRTMNGAIRIESN